MGLARKFYYAISPSMRYVIRRIYYLPIDIYETIVNKRNPMIPPKGLIFIGSGDFKKQGDHLLDLLIKYADLKPDNTVLDIGCGIGRLAVPLTQYLNPDTHYEGFDIVKIGIEWCEKKITTKYPNFHFLFVDLKNDLYNLKTNEEAKSFKFPYPEKSFDCIVLTSVFTHMMPEDVDNYLKQISFVMKDNGKCLASFFLLNSDVKKQMLDNKIKFQFPYQYNGYSLMDKNVKEANIAYEETFLSSILKKNGLSTLSIYQGSWSNGASALDFQDVVIIKKK